MRNGKLTRIGSLIPLVGLAVLTIGGVAHANQICIPYIGCFNVGGGGNGGHTGAPELDLGMAVSGVTMLVASILVIVERRRRR
jgi:hypothetical protein